MATTTRVNPLAQSFMIKLPGGCFATSLDLFFLTKDTNTNPAPVSVELREMDNGVPTPRVLPFSRVTLPASSVNVVDLDTTDPDPTLATTFTFPSPVYLRPHVFYAIVVHSTAPKYSLWTATKGEINYIDQKRVDVDPNIGVMFKSQNASTWTPEQNQDLKFSLKRAVFDVSSPGTLSLINQNPPTLRLPKNPIATVNGSSVIRVYHKNHGFFVGSSVTLGGLTPATSYNGILGSAINGTHTILAAEQDSYTVDPTDAADATGLIGGTDVTATTQIVYSTFMTSVNHYTYPGSSASWGYKGTTGKSLSGSETPYSKSTAWAPIIDKTNITEDNTRVVAHSDNMGTSSFDLRCIFDSAKPNLSPVFDLERAHMISIQNRIDNPTGDTYLLVPQSSSTGSGIDSIFNISISGGSYVVDSIVEGGSGHAATDDITILGSFLGGTDGVNDLTFNVATISGGAIATVDTIAGTPITLGTKNLVSGFVSETRPTGGSALAKYVSKPVQLDSASTTLKMYLDVNRPWASYVDVYYRINIDTDGISLENWVLAEPDEAIPITDNPSDFNEIEYTLDTVSDYSVFQVKIVLRSDSAANVPVIRAFRAIALA